MPKLIYKIDNNTKNKLTKNKKEIRKSKEKVAREVSINYEIT